MNSAKFFYVLLILAVISTTALSIKCYICSSRTNENCADIEHSSNSSILQECPQRSEKQFCRKSVQVLNDADLTIVTRDCGWIEFEKHSDDYCMTSNTNFKKEVSCQCFQEGCNGSGRLITSPVLFLSIVYAAFSLSSC